MKVTEAARLMGKDPQFVRIGLQRGLLPFGWAIKTDPVNKRYSYFISEKLFNEYIGQNKAAEC